ncbi:hypothetical protein PGB90_003904 [Kerria lacca]
MNPCECFINHELAMRRLLSILRQTQTECNDSECFDLSSMNLNSSGLMDNSFLIYSMLWIAIGFFLYFFRPASLRNTKNNFQGFNNDNDDNAGPSHLATGTQ